MKSFNNNPDIRKESNFSVFQNGRTIGCRNLKIKQTQEPHRHTGKKFKKKHGIKKKQDKHQQSFIQKGNTYA